MKATENELEQHLLIVNKNDLALAKLFDRYGEHIVGSLKNFYEKTANMDVGLILEAVNEAFFGYYKNPGTFDPNQSTLLRFLQVAAERDLLNILQREQKHFSKNTLPDDVELEEKFWNSIKKDNQSTDAPMIEEQAIIHVDEVLKNYFKSSIDVEIAKMVLAGERETDAFAQLLNIEDYSDDSKKKEVKKQKDRIKATLKRHDVEAKIKKVLL